MKFRTALLGLLLSLVGSVLGFVSAGKLPVHGFSLAPQQLAACGIHCGTERWGVKTLSDADHDEVDFTPKKTTVASLVSQKSPAYLPADRRVAPVESQTYKVRASLVGYWPEQDEDIHLVIADLDDANKTMIVEIPSPDCAGACTSGHVEDFRRARAVIAALPEQFACLTVVVTGVGFFDFLHGQAGAAPNGIELHPVLNIELESGSGSNCQSGLTTAPASSPSSKGNAPTSTGQAGNPDVKVWVNTNSGVYHCPGTRWYGNTKQGEYMTQKKAQAGGYRPAYGNVCQ